MSRGDPSAHGTPPPIALRIVGCALRRGDLGRPDEGAGGKGIFVEYPIHAFSDVELGCGKPRWIAVGACSSSCAHASSRGIPIPPRRSAGGVLDALPRA